MTKFIYGVEIHGDPEEILEVQYLLEAEYSTALPTSPLNPSTHCEYCAMNNECEGTLVCAKQRMFNTNL
jgi:hypothetical protein